MFLKLLQPAQKIALFAALAFLMAGVFVSFGFINRRNRYPQKIIPFECGNDPLTLDQPKFGIRYYLVAMLFIIFDVEVALLFPWAVQAKALGTEGFVHVMLFTIVLSVGLIYEWQKGALEWQ